MDVPHLTDSERLVIERLAVVTRTLHERILGTSETVIRLGELCTHITNNANQLVDSCNASAAAYPDEVGGSMFVTNTSLRDIITAQISASIALLAAEQLKWNDVVTAALQLNIHTFNYLPA